MSWLKFETTTPDKVEVFELARILGLDPDAVVGKLLRVWAWFDQHTEDGSANVSGILLLDRLAGVAGFCDAMAQVDWLIIEDDAIGLPNFDRHNGHSAKNRLLSAERKRRERDNVAAKSRPNRDKSVTRIEKNRIEKKKTTLSGKPDAVDILNYLNSKAGKSFRPGEAHIKMIMARLKEPGVVVEGVREMIDSKCAAWLTDDKMGQFLRPQTLFNKTKFANYYDERKNVQGNRDTTAAQLEGGF